MDKSEIRIFIVDDDPTMNSALREIVKKMGYLPVVCSNPTDAENQFRIQGAHLFIIDCLLPKMSGVDLAQKLRKEGAKDTPIILLSGIYKDKAFIKEALHKTGAINYFSKPLDIKDIQQTIAKAVESHVDETTPAEILLTSNLSPAEKIGMINQLGQIEAFDIPWMCCLLMNASAMGNLRLTTEKGNASISFSNGTIVQVEMQNPESFFGALLVENGYLTTEQLDMALKTKSSKKLGERLVDLNFLSPHVIDVINAEQTAIRLSRIITEASYNVSFEEKEIQSSSSCIDTENIATFLVDWIHSKIDSTWLKQRYLKWLNNSTVKVSSNNTTYRRLWSLAPLKNVPALISEFDQGTTLSQVLAKGQFKEDLVYQVFHLLLLIGYIHLKREMRAVDQNAQVARLQKIWQDMGHQDYFGVLGVPRNAKPADVKRTYYELAKIFHPDKLPQNATPQLRDLTQKVFGKMTLAYETLSNEQKRTDYIKEIEMGRAEKILQAETLLEDGKAALKSANAKKALEKFEAAVALKQPTSELLIHLAWARMMVDGGMSEENLMSVESTLNKIPPEDRHNYIYYFVKGLFQRLIGEDAAARKNIQHALALNPKFLEAERAMRALEAKKTQKVDLLHGDLGSVVGNLFRKK